MSELPVGEGFLYERLATTVTDLIEAGTLRPGDRLPSVRRFSRQQGVSVSTVLQAYRLLEDRRRIEARPQSGFYVRDAPDALHEPGKSAPPATPSEVDVSALISDVMAALIDPEVVPFGAAEPGSELLPTGRLNRTLSAVMRRAGARSNAYRPPEGELMLRREIARRALDAGCSLTPDDLVVTNGCMEALSLCLRTVAAPGDTVAVESPAYFGVLQLIEHLGMKALEVATFPREGLCLDAFDEATRRTRVAACIVTPNFHNPFGSRMPDEKKARLVALAAERGVPLIEDDVYGELYFQAPRPRSLLAFDTAGGVLSCGSFSKTLAPGYRVGWAAPGPFRAAVLLRKLATSIATATPLQLGLAAYLAQGGYDHHLRRLRRTFADTLAHLARSVAAHFPEGTRVTRPQGGFVLWVELPAPCSAFALYRAALARGISIAPGPIFSATGRYERCIRLNGGHRWSPRLAQAVERLGELARTQAS